MNKLTKHIITWVIVIAFITATVVYIPFGLESLAIIGLLTILWGILVFASIKGAKL